MGRREFLYFLSLKTYSRKLDVLEKILVGRKNYRERKRTFLFNSRNIYNHQKRKATLKIVSEEMFWEFGMGKEGRGGEDSSYV